MELDSIPGIPVPNTQVFFYSMHTLFLDVASHAGLLALVHEKKIIASLPVDHRLSDHEVLPRIDELLRRGGSQFSGPKDIDRIACVLGPGGFMSLRAGVSLTNAMSMVLDVPTCGVHLSDLYRARIMNDELRMKNVWLHSTKKSQLFFRRFPQEPICIDVEALSSHVHKGEAWMGELISEHRTIVDTLGLVPADLRTLDEVLPPFLARQEYRKDRILEPWYGRGW